MDILIQPGPLQGTLIPPPSKSMAHRYLICAALSDRDRTIICPDAGEDIAATVQCLQALGADIQATHAGFTVHPIEKAPEKAVLSCRESGSTLRFLLPVCGALGVDTTFRMEGRLPYRPLDPLWKEMERMGCHLSRPEENTIRCQGRLQSGHYCIRGDISSQFISGLLLAMPLIGKDCQLQIQGRLESAPYVDMTAAAVQLFQNGAPKHLVVEGDWSNAAFWFAANTMGSQIALENLSCDSLQGDHKILSLLSQLETHATISVADIPDLMPILAVKAATAQGALFTDIGRLRMKESDRVASTAAMIHALGGKTEVSDNSLSILPTGLTGGCVDAYSDHRIAMSAAIAATVCREPVAILGAECVGKSYPDFWKEYARLGGKYGKYLR